MPFKKYFEFLSRKIFKRRKLKIQNIFYKNYYLVELNSDTIIFSLQSLYNISSEYGEGGSKYQFKIHKKEQIWKEILFHCHVLKNNYMNKYSLNFNEEKYHKYYAILELKSTFPRRTFFIKFLPILNGLALIHEYVQIKLASIKGYENIYKECESIYGFKEDINIDKNNNRLVLLKNEPLILKKVNLFFIESLMIKTPSLGLFKTDKQNYLYISQEIMNIINRHIVSLKEYNILKNIEKALYEEYLEIINAQNIDYEINSDNNLYMKKNNDNNSSDDDIYDIDEDNNPKKLSLNITKKFILTALFDKEFNLPSGSKDKNIFKTSFSHIECNKLKENNTPNKKHPNSKKDVNKLSEILNDSISNYTGTLNIFKNHKNEENNNVTENNTFKTSNIFDSNILFNNGEYSMIKDDLFNIDISNVQCEEKISNKKNGNLVYCNRNIDLQNNKNNKNSFEFVNSKEIKRKESYNKGNSGLDYLGSKEEFLEGEIKNKVK